VHHYLAPSPRQQPGAAPTPPLTQDDETEEKIRHQHSTGLLAKQSWYEYMHAVQSMAHILQVLQRGERRLDTFRLGALCSFKPEDDSTDAVLRERAVLQTSSSQQQSRSSCKSFYRGII
jgi:hypothetical protein